MKFTSVVGSNLGAAVAILGLMTVLGLIKIQSDEREAEILELKRMSEENISSVSTWENALIEKIDQLQSKIEEQGEIINASPQISDKYVLKLPQTNLITKSEVPRTVSSEGRRPTNNPLAGIKLGSADTNSSEPSSDKRLSVVTKKADELKRRLASVPAKYNTPPKLDYGRTTAITFVLETQGMDKAVGLFDAFIGPVVSTDVRVSAEVIASLSGPDDLVQIKPRRTSDSGPKTVTTIAPVQWIWDVKAVGAGTVVLNLELSALLEKGNAGKTIQIKTFSQKIPIEITPKDYIIKTIADFNPIFTFGSAFVAGIGGLLTFFGLRPKKADQAAEKKDS